MCRPRAVERLAWQRIVSVLPITLIALARIVSPRACGARGGDAAQGITDGAERRGRARGGARGGGRGERGARAPARLMARLERKKNVVS